MPSSALNNGADRRNDPRAEEATASHADAAPMKPLPEFDAVDAALSIESGLVRPVRGRSVQSKPIEEAGAAAAADKSAGQARSHKVPANPIAAESTPAVEGRRPKSAGASKSSKPSDASKTKKTSKASKASKERTASKAAVLCRPHEHAGAELAASFAALSEPEGLVSKDSAAAAAEPPRTDRHPPAPDGPPGAPPYSDSRAEASIAPTEPTAGSSAASAPKSGLKAASGRKTAGAGRAETGAPSDVRKQGRQRRAALDASAEMPNRPPTAAPAVPDARPAEASGIVVFQEAAGSLDANASVGSVVLELETSMSSLTPVVPIPNDAWEASPCGRPSPTAQPAESIRTDRRASVFPKNRNGIAIMSRSRTAELGAAMGNALGEAFRTAEACAAPDQSRQPQSFDPDSLPDQAEQSSDRDKSCAVHPETAVLAGPRRAITKKSKADRLPPLETLPPPSLKADMADVRALEANEGAALTARSLRTRRDALEAERLEARSAASLDEALKQSPQLAAALADAVVAQREDARLAAGLCTPSAPADAPWYLQGASAIELHLQGLEAAGTLDAGADQCGDSSFDEAQALRCSTMTAAALGEALSGLLAQVRTLQAAMNACGDPRRYEYAASCAAKSLVVVLRRFAELSQSHAENARAMLVALEEDGLLRPDLSEERIRGIRRPSGFRFGDLLFLARSAGASAVRLLSPVRPTSAGAASENARTPAESGRLLRRLAFFAAAGALAGLAAGWAFSSKAALGIFHGAAACFDKLPSGSSALDSVLFAAAAEPVRVDAEALFARAARVRLAMVDPNTGEAPPEADGLTRECIDASAARWERENRRWIVNWPDRDAPGSPFEPVGAFLRLKLERQAETAAPDASSAARLQMLPDATQDLLNAVPILSAGSNASIDDEALNARIAARWGIAHDRR